MTSPTTHWPTHPPIPGPTRSLIALHFAINDNDHSSHAGRRLATEVFAPNAVWKTPSGTFSGAGEISHSRSAAWNGIRARKHDVQRVYACDGPSDLVLSGVFTLTLEDGSEVASDFCAKVGVVKVEGGGGVRFGSFQGFVDQGPLRDKLGGKGGAKEDMSGAEVELVARRCHIMK